MEASQSGMWLGFKEIVQGAIGRAIEIEKEKSIEEATQAFEKRVREAVGQVVIQAADYYSVERNGTDLVIHVKYTTEKSR